MSPPIRIAALAAVALTLLSACGSDTASPPATSTSSMPVTTPPTSGATTTTGAPPTTDPPTEEEAILAAVEGFWWVLLDASSGTPNPEHPDLDRYLTGQQLEVSRQVIRNRLDLGQSARLPEDSLYSHQTDVQSVSDGIAIVTDCGVDDGVLYDRATGIILNDSVDTRLWTITLVYVEDSWKVSDSSVEAQWEGIESCEP